MTGTVHAVIGLLRTALRLLEVEARRAAGAEIGHDPELSRAPHLFSATRITRDGASADSLSARQGLLPPAGGIDPGPERIARPRAGRMLDLRSATVLVVPLVASRCPP